MDHGPWINDDTRFDFNAVVDEAAGPHMAVVRKICTIHDDGIRVDTLKGRGWLRVQQANRQCEGFTRLGVTPDAFRFMILREFLIVGQKQYRGLEMKLGVAGVSDPRQITFFCVFRFCDCENFHRRIPFKLATQFLDQIRNLHLGVAFRGIWVTPRRSTRTVGSSSKLVVSTTLP